MPLIVDKYLKTWSIQLIHQFEGLWFLKIQGFVHRIKLRLSYYVIQFANTFIKCNLPITITGAIIKGL